MAGYKRGETTLTQMLLKWLGENPGGGDCATLALILGRSTANIGSTMNNLQRAGLILGIPAPAKLRGHSRKLWVLTEHVPAVIPTRQPFKRTAAKLLSKTAQAIQPANVKRTIAAPIPDRWAVTLPPGGGEVTRAWRAERLGAIR